MGPRWQVSVGLNARDYKRGAEQLEGSSRRAGRAMGQLDGRSSRLERTLKRLGRIVATIAAGTLLGAIAQDAGRLATLYDDALTKVNTLVGVHRSQVQGWREDLLEIGPAVGRLPKELGPALFTITSAGERGSEALDIVEKAGKAAAVGLGETAVVAKTVTAALQAYGKENLSAGQATDVLVATVREGNLEASELSGALGRVLGIASQVGVTFGQVGGFVATFTRLGVDSAESVTALRGILTTLIRPTRGAGEALRSVGLTIQDLRDSIRERGLARTLVDLIERFRGNEEALSQLIPNVRALSGVLGTAGSQAEEFLRIEEAVVHSTGTLEKAFAGVADSPGHAFRQLAASVEVLKIAFGDALAKGVADSVSRLQDLSEMGPELERFGALVGDGLGLAVSGLSLLVEHVDLVKAALLALIALQLVRWLTASAAATKLLTVANLELGTAVWAVRSGYAKLIALDLLVKLRAWAAASAAWAGSLVAISAPILAAAAAVAVLHVAINRISSDLDRSMAELITRGEGVRSKLEQAAGAVRQMSQAQLGVRKASLSTELAKVSGELGEIRSQVAAARVAMKAAATAGVDSYGSQGDAISKTSRKLRELLAKQSDLADRAAVLRGELGQVSDRLVELGEENDWARRLDEAFADFNAGLEDANTGLETAAQKAARLDHLMRELEIPGQILQDVDQIKARIEALEFDEFWAGLGEQSSLLVTNAQLVEEAISRGIPPTEEMLAKHGDMLAQLILQRGQYENILQLNQDIANALEESVGRLADLNLSGLRQSLEAELSGIEIDLTPSEADFDRMGKEVADAAEVGGAKVREELIEAYQEAASIGARILTGMLADIGAGGQDVFRNLWNSFLDLGYQAIEQILQRWLATKFADKAVNLTTSGGSLEGATQGAASAGLGTFSTFAAVAAIYTAVFDYFESRGDRIAAERFGSQVQLQYGEGIIVGGAHTGFEEDVRSPLSRAADAARETLRELLAAIGGFVDEVPRFAVEVQNGGELFRATVESSITGVFEEIGTFRSYEEALEASMLEAIRRADFSEVGENVALLLERSLTNSLERFHVDLELAQFLDRVGLSETQVWVQEFLGRAGSVISRVREIGLSLEDAERALIQEAAARRRSTEATLEAALGYDDSADRILAAREAALSFNEGAGQLEDTLLRAREQARQLAESPGLGTSGDHVEDFQDTSDRIGTSLDELGRDFDVFEEGIHKAKEGVESLSGAVERIDLAKIEEAVRAVADDQLGAVTDRLVALLGPLGHAAELQEVIALREQARLVAELRGIDQQIASIRLLQAETGVLTELQLRHLRLLEGLRERLGELFESGALANLPSPRPISVSAGDGGFRERERARARLRAQFEQMVAIADGTFSEVADNLRRENEELRSELERLSVFSAEYIDQFIALNTQLAQADFLAPFQAIVDREDLGEFDFQIQELERAREAALRNGEAMGLSAVQMEVVRRAFEIQAEALKEEEGARVAAAEAARQLRLEELASSIEDLRSATGLSVDEIETRRADLVQAFQEMGSSSRELIADINAAAQAAVQGSGLRWLEQTLSRIGATSPEVSAALLELERVETLTTLSTYALAGAFESLADFDLEAVTQMINDAYDALIEAAHRPPPRIPPQTLAPAPAAAAVGESLADVLADMQGVIADWTGPTLDQWQAEIARLRAIYDEYLERILAAGGSATDAAPLLDALAQAIQRVKDSALDALRELREQLFFQAPTLLPADQLARLEAQFNTLSSAALAGDTQAQNQIAGVIQQLYALLEGSYGTASVEYGRIDALIQAFLDQLLGPNPFASLLPPPPLPAGAIDPFVGAGGGGGGGGFGPAETGRGPAEGRLAGAIEGLSAELAGLRGEVGGLREEVGVLHRRNEELGSFVQRSIYERRP